MKNIIIETPELVDFAVTARKYKTQLTKKFKNRKVWIEPNPFEIQSYIPGTIIQISVKEGDVVKEGDPLLILEAMKMENSFLSPRDGIIKSIAVEKGNAVDKGQLLIEFE